MTPWDPKHERHQKYPVFPQLRNLAFWADMTLPTYVLMSKVMRCVSADELEV